jgi:hypothetical protein
MDSFQEIVATQVTKGKQLQLLMAATEIGASNWMAFTFSATIFSCGRVKHVLLQFFLVPRILESSEVPGDIIKPKNK